MANIYEWVQFDTELKSGDLRLRGSFASSFCGFSKCVWKFSWLLDGSTAHVEIDDTALTLHFLSTSPSTKSHYRKKIQRSTHLTSNIHKDLGILCASTCFCLSGPASSLCVWVCVATMGVAGLWKHTPPCQRTLLSVQPDKFISLS